MYFDKINYSQRLACYHFMIQICLRICHKMFSGKKSGNLDLSRINSIFQEFGHSFNQFHFLIYQMYFLKSIKEGNFEVISHTVQLKRQQSTNIGYNSQNELAPDE